MCSSTWSRRPKDWAGLGDAYQVDARITVFSRDDVTIVPTGALFRSGELGASMWCRTDGRNVARWNCCADPGRFAAVTAGVQPGDRVIVYPSDRIAPEVRVESR